MANQVGDLVLPIGNVHHDSCPNYSMSSKILREDILPNISLAKSHLSQHRGFLPSQPRVPRSTVAVYILNQHLPKISLAALSPTMSIQMLRELLMNIPMISILYLNSIFLYMIYTNTYIEYMNMPTCLPSKGWVKAKQMFSAVHFYNIQNKLVAS